MFPEFERTEDQLCLQKINAATARTAAAVWGDKVNDGIMWLAAHLLSMSPEGEQSRLKAENRATTYERTLNMMRREVTFGAGRVI
jgi:hypothetical protein